MASRKPKQPQLPDGLLPDRDAPLDPRALHRFLKHTPLTADQARALVTEANARARRAKTARAKQHRAFLTTMTHLAGAQKRHDYAAGIELAQQAGALWNQLERATLDPIIKAAEAARNRAKGRKLGREWNEGKQRDAAAIATWYVHEAAKLKAGHPAWSRNTIITRILADLRRKPGGAPKLRSTRQIQRYLADS